jgi:uncharacterized membrane protein YhaH (DUF805 family)
LVGVATTFCSQHGSDVVIASWPEERREDGNGEPIVFDYRSDIAGTIWLVYLILFPATLALILFIETSVNNDPVLTLIAFVLYFWVAICITVKRLHDIDATGWLSIPVALIPIAVILVGSFPGTVGPNRFGPDPLERQVMD